MDTPNFTAEGCVQRLSVAVEVLAAKRGVSTISNTPCPRCGGILQIRAVKPGSGTKPDGSHWTGLVETTNCSGCNRVFALVFISRLPITKHWAPCDPISPLPPKAS